MSRPEAPRHRLPQPHPVIRQPEIRQPEVSPPEVPRPEFLWPEVLRPDFRWPELRRPGIRRAGIRRAGIVRATRRPLFVAALLLIGAARSAPVTAQSPPALTPGEEVRVSWWDDRYSYAWGGPHVLTADVVGVTEGSILLRRGNRVVAVPLGTVRRVQRRVGTKPASAPAMVIGSAGGFAAGFVLGAVTGGIEAGSESIDRVDAGLTTGVLIGAPLGALIAWLASRSRGIYEDVPFGSVLSAMVAQPDGRVGFRIPTGNW